MRLGPAFPLALAAALAATPALAAKPEAADKTLGMALLSAAVAADGTLLHGVGVTDNITTGTGSYDIDFVRDIVGCTFVASVGLPQNVIAPVGFAQPRHVGGNGIRVRTYDAGGSDADRPFQVIVFCAQ